MNPPLDLLEETIGHVVARLNSLDLSQLAVQLPEDIEEAAEDFCERFELGNWFYEALIVNEAKIGSMLSRIAAERMGLENEFAESYQEQRESVY